MEALRNGLTEPSPYPHAAKMTQRDDFVWLRILDVAAFLGGRAYDRAGSVVIEVTDEMGLAGGRYVLDASPDDAECRPTSASPGLTIPIGVLGSAALGGVRLRTLADAGHLDVHDQAAPGNRRRPPSLAGHALVLDLVLRARSQRRGANSVRASAPD